MLIYLLEHARVRVYVGLFIHSRLLSCDSYGERQVYVGLFVHSCLSSCDSFWPLKDPRLMESPRIRFESPSLSQDARRELATQYTRTGQRSPTWQKENTVSP
jgi:hypothetical protein